MKICNVCKTILSDEATYCPKCNNASFSHFATKRCPFCNSEVALGTIVCPHCHRILPPERDESSQKEQNTIVNDFRGVDNEIKATGNKRIEQSISKGNSVNTEEPRIDDSAFNKLFKTDYDKSNYTPPPQRVENNGYESQPVVKEEPKSTPSSIFGTNYDVIKPNINFDFSNVPKEVPPANPNFCRMDKMPEFAERTDSFAPPSRGKFDEKGRFIPMEYVKNEEETKKEVEKLVGSDKVQPQPVEEKKGQTIIYNQIFSNGVPNNVGQPITNTEVNPEEGFKNIFKVGNDSQVFDGAPTIVGLDENKKAAEENQVIGKQPKNKVHKNNKKQKNVEGKVLLASPKAKAALFISLILLIGSIACLLMLPILNLRGEQIMGIPLLLTRIPISLQDNFPCGFIEFGTRGGLTGIYATIYYLIPYIYDGIAAATIITILAYLFGFKYNKGVKVFGIIFNLLLLLATVGIGVFCYITFDFATIGHGLMGQAACYLISLIVLAAGYKATLVDREEE